MRGEIAFLTKSYSACIAVKKQEVKALAFSSPAPSTCFLSVLSVWEGNPAAQVRLLLLTREPHFEKRWGRCCHSHFVVEKTEVQRDSITSLRPFGQKAAEQILPWRSAWFGALYTLRFFLLVFFLTLPPMTLRLPLGTTVSFPTL